MKKVGNQGKMKSKEVQGAGKAIARLFKPLDLMLKSPITLFFFFLGDLIFLLALFLFNNAFVTLVPSFRPSGTTSMFIASSVLLIFIYSIGCIVLYSSIKSVVLISLKRGRWHWPSFQMWKSFVGLSAFFILLLLGAYLIISYIGFTFVQQDLIGWFGILTLTPFVMVWYPAFLLAQQKVVLSDDGMYAILVSAITYTVQRIRGIGLLYLATLVVTAAYSLFFFMVVALLNMIIFKDNPYHPLFQTYQVMFFAITLTVLWLIACYHRIYFMQLTGDA